MKHLLTNTGDGIGRCWFFPLVIAALGLWISGCGGSQAGMPPLGQVNGRITLDDQPLDGAEVIFQPADGRPSVGKSDSSGHYKMAYTMDVNGAMVGAHKVTITSARTASGGEGGQPLVASRKEILPVKYHTKSELTADVKKGSNTIDFALKSK